MPLPSGSQSDRRQMFTAITAQSLAPMMPFARYSSSLSRLSAIADVHRRTRSSLGFVFTRISPPGTGDFEIVGRNAMRAWHNRLDPDCPARVLNPKVGAVLPRALGDTFRLVTLSSEVSIEHRFPDARPQFAFVASLDFVDEMWRPDIGFDVLGQQLAEVSSARSCCSETGARAQQQFADGDGAKRSWLCPLDEESFDQVSRL